MKDPSRGVVAPMAAAAAAFAKMSGASGTSGPQATDLDGGRPAEGLSVDPTPFVHPQLQPFIAPIQQMVGPPGLDDEILAGRRKLDFSKPPMAEPPWFERLVPGLPGEPDVRIYVINAAPADRTGKPAILHIHGGGFVMRDARSAVQHLQELALQLDCVIVTVDYRLAPETPFPGALNDNYASLKWLHANAAELGVDRARIALMGDSAGGGHAAMLAIALRDRGEALLVYQALVYPMLDDRTGSTRKVPPNQGLMVWSPQENRFGWSAHLGSPAGSVDLPYGSVPARVEDLCGLPPTFIGVGAVDLFVDEDIEYARRLIAAGVPTELIVVPGAFHGFDGLVQAEIVQQFNAALVSALRTALHPAR